MSNSACTKTLIMRTKEETRAFAAFRAHFREYQRNFTTEERLSAADILLMDEAISDEGLNDREPEDYCEQ